MNGKPKVVGKAFGFDLVIDPDCPPDELQVRDRDGAIIARVRDFFYEVRGRRYEHPLP